MQTIHRYRILIVAQNNNNMLHRNGCYPLLGAGDLKTKTMANSSSSSSSGIGFFGLLGVAFIVLKLCKVIDWSWWLVTLPLWGGIGLILLILLVVLIIAIASRR